MAIFNSYVSHYQRVKQKFTQSIGKSIGLSQLHRCPEKQLCHRDNRPPVLRTADIADWLCPMRNVWDSARLQGTKVQLSELSKIQWLCSY